MVCALYKYSGIFTEMHSSQHKIVNFKSTCNVVAKKKYEMGRLGLHPTLLVQLLPSQNSMPLQKCATQARIGYKSPLQATLPKNGLFFYHHSNQDEYF
ncbi:hypothetical protein IX84_22880 [Phaeodactylibacter xiamenensis]|uniref:Uncharacterized protein n=1 Tax=Phaeodactylibacter xiamenensis TaxID=1524460 RepID=A0A098S2E6_9BACT|nr:hypothetical protein IX84_22880 [Phaeodactylibacter xiamenensis]